MHCSFCNGNWSRLSKSWPRLSSLVFAGTFQIKLLSSYDQYATSHIDKYFRTFAEHRYISGWLKQHSSKKNRNCTKLLVHKTTQSTFQRKNLWKNQIFSIIEQSNYVKYVGILIGKYLNFNFHIAEELKNLSKHYSVKSRLRHFLKKPVLLQYYNTYIKSVIGYGLVIYVCTSKNNETYF